MERAKDAAYQLHLFYPDDGLALPAGASLEAATLDDAKLEAAIIFASSPAHRHPTSYLIRSAEGAVVYAFP